MTKSGQSPFLFHTTKNGLQIIGQPTKLRQSAAVGFFVKTGSRDEASEESGVSHFLEHMLFKGTAKRSALEITYEMGNIGAQANAFTSEENTVYYGGVLPEFIPAMLDILCDMMRPALRQEDFDTEKQVILEEIALYQDRPTFFLFEHATTDYFDGHPAGNSVLGSSDSIKSLTRDQMQAYFDRRYAPNNMALVATGNFDWEKLIDDAEARTSHWSQVPTARATPPFQSKGGQREYRKKNLHQSHVLLVADAASATDKERFALGLVSLILGDSSGSKLYWELVDAGLADSAGADCDEKEGVGTFSAYATTAPEQFSRVREILRAAVESVGTFSDDDLERARTKVMTRLVQSNELPMGQLMALGIEWNQRRHVETLQETIQHFRALTRKDIEAALERFPLSRWSEFTLVSDD
jgi:predicted Zn-dependent peptidase